MGPHRESVDGRSQHGAARCRPSRRPARALLLLLGLAAGCAGPAVKYKYVPQLTSPGADLRAALSIASGFEAVEGNSVTILENGENAFPAMLAAIGEASRTIHLENNIFRDGIVGREFVEALAERARAGVKVRMLIDAFGASLGSDNEAKLREAGVHLVYFRPFDLAALKKIHLRTHRKVLIIDGTTGFTGGICFDDAWQGSGEGPNHWRDIQLLVKGPVLRQMQIAFARAWAEATGELLSGRNLFAAEPSGPLVCQLMDSVPGSATNPAKLSFLVSTSSARRTIDITMAYFVPDHRGREALKNAVERGVRVRLILASRQTDINAIRYAGRSYYHELLEAGIEIYEYQPARLHAKTMIVDGAWTSIGSTNLDRRSFAFNFESNLNVFDEGFAAQMETIFERDLARSKRITLEAWKKRPFKEKFLETFYHLFSPQY